MSTPISPLDKALVSAREHPEQQASFYEAFLKSDLFIPTIDPAGHDSEPRRSREGESFTPYVVEQNGKPYLPVFDLLDRLSNWIQREMTYVRMPAHALVLSIQAEVHLALNVGTDFWKEFVPDELQWLRQSVQQAQPRSTTVPAGTQILVGVPAHIPAGLQEALRDCLHRNPEILRAFIGQVHLVAPGEKPHLVIALEPDRPVQAVIESIRQDVGISVKPFIQKDTYIGIALVGVDRIAADITHATSPFYLRHDA